MKNIVWGSILICAFWSFFFSIRVIPDYIPDHILGIIIYIRIFININSKSCTLLQWVSYFAIIATFMIIISWCLNIQWVRHTSVILYIFAVCCLLVSMFIHDMMSLYRQFRFLVENRRHH